VQQQASLLLIDWLASGGSTVVELSPQHHKVQGSSQADTGRDQLEQKYWLIVRMTQFEMADTKTYFIDDGKAIGQPAKSAMKHDLVLAISNGVKISSIKMIQKTH
jgi:hypothetical protein